MNLPLNSSAFSLSNWETLFFKGRLFTLVDFLRTINIPIYEQLYLRNYIKSVIVYITVVIIYFTDKMFDLVVKMLLSCLLS